jgi:hypothetical protein
MYGCFGKAVLSRAASAVARPGVIIHETRGSEKWEVYRVLVNINASIAHLHRCHGRAPRRRSLAACRCSSWPTWPGLPRTCSATRPPTPLPCGYVPPSSCRTASPCSPLSQYVNTHTARSCPSKIYVTTVWVIHASDLSSCTPGHVWHSQALAAAAVEHLRSICLRCRSSGTWSATRQPSSRRRVLRTCFSHRGWI